MLKIIFIEKSTTYKKLEDRDKETKEYDEVLKNEGIWVLACH